MKTRLPLIGGLLLGAAFVFFGLGKVSGQEASLLMFQAWGLPVWFVYVTGVMELLGGVLSAIPKTRFFGAALVAMIMLGAIGTHAMNADFGGMFPLSIVFLVIAAAVSYASRPQGDPLGAPSPQRN